MKGVEIMHPRRQRRSGMRNALGTLLLLLLVPACKSDKPPAAQAATLPARADDSAARTIVAPAGKEWAQPGGDYAPSRYSSLAEITPANAGQLKVVSTL